jgi:hypothetical protein
LANAAIVVLKTAFFEERVREGAAPGGRGFQGTSAVGLKAVIPPPRGDEAVQNSTLIMRSRWLASTAFNF